MSWSCSVDEDRAPSLKQPLELELDAPDEGTWCAGNSSPLWHLKWPDPAESDDVMAPWMDATEQLRAFAKRSSSSWANSSDRER